MTETVKKRQRKESSKTPEERQRERRERFLKHAARRVNTALQKLVYVGRLGNRATYAYTDEEAQKIIETVMDAATDVRDSFMSTKSEKPMFTL